MSAQNRDESHESEAASEYASARTIIEACESSIAEALSTADTKFNLTPAAMLEARQALDKAGRKILAIKNAEEAEIRNQKLAKRASTLDYPVGSMVRHAYAINIAFNPNGVNDGLDTFDVVGEVCDVNYNGEVLTTSMAEAKLPKKAKLDILAFDRLVEKIAAELPKLVLTSLAELEKEKCLEAVEKMQQLTVGQGLYDIEGSDDDSDDDLE
jgi:hypothetical protein